MGTCTDIRSVDALGTLRRVSSRRSGRRSQVLRRRTLVVLAVLVCAAVAVGVAVHGGHGPSGSPPSTTATSAPQHPSAAPRFAVGTLTMTLTEPVAPGGAARSLPTTVRYPAVGSAGAPDRALAVPDTNGGPYPLIVFSEGYDIDPETYAPLLDAWAAAGYVVADPVYPFTAPSAPGGPMRSDIVNHPGDLRFVITSVLEAGSTPGGPLTGMIAAHEVGVIGHSDGGDVSLAVASNSCCRDPRVKAVVVLSGAELAAFGGTYFSPPAVPMLVVQGTNDDMNPPSCSVQLYNQAPQPKYYLSMLGQTHTSAYTQAGAPLTVVATVTVDFLNQYLKQARTAPGALVDAGTVPGLSSLTRAPSVPPDPQPCPDAPGSL